MDKNGVVIWVLACLAITVMVAAATAMMSESMRQSSQQVAFVEMAWNWFTRVVGMGTVVVGIMLMLFEGVKNLSWQGIAKYVVLILIGLLVVNYSWAIVLGIVVSLALLAVSDLLKKNVNPESSQA